MSAQSALQGHRPAPRKAAWRSFLPSRRTPHSRIFFGMRYPLRSSPIASRLPHEKPRLPYPFRAASFSLTLEMTAKASAT